MSSLLGMFHQVGPALHEYGLWVVFVNLLLETFGLPLPGETMLITASLLAAKGQFSLTELLITAWTTSVLGDNIAFYVGRYGGRRLLLRLGGKIGINRHRIRRMDRFYKRFGPEVVLVARFFAVARQLNGLVGGALEMAPLRFFIYNLIGSALWVGAWGLGTYYLGNHMRVALTWSTRIMVPAMITSIVIGILLLVYRIWKSRKR